MTQGHLLLANTKSNRSKKKCLCSILRSSYLPSVFFLFLFFAKINNAFAQATKGTRYKLEGKAVHQGATQGYLLNVVDDGTGLLKGNNISIVENNRQIIGEVIGKIDYAKRRIYFKETRVTNLRPGETQMDYCFFEVIADYIVNETSTIIKGKFEGHGPTGIKCGNGDIYLIATRNVEKIRRTYLAEEKAKQDAVAKLRAEAAARKAEQKRLEQVAMQKAKQLKLEKMRQDSIASVLAKLEDEKKKIAPLPEKNIQVSVNPDASNYEFDADTLHFLLSDYDKEDGDRINVYINDSLLMSNHTIGTQPDSFTLYMRNLLQPDGSATISIQAINEGYYNVNSSKLVVRDANFQYTFYACNTVGQRKQLILRKRKEQQ